MHLCIFVDLFIPNASVFLVLHLLLPSSIFLLSLALSFPLFLSLPPSYSPSSLLSSLLGCDAVMASVPHCSSGATAQLLQGKERLPTGMSVCLSVWLAGWLAGWLFVCLFVCLVCLSGLFLWCLYFYFVIHPSSINPSSINPFNSSIHELTSSSCDTRREVGDHIFLLHCLHCYMQLGALKSGPTSIFCSSHPNYSHCHSCWGEIQCETIYNTN